MDNLLSLHLSFAVGGLLNATFGNITELIISIYALKSGMIRVVQQSLLGSILSNMLLVLGCAFFSGGIVFYEKEQVFDMVCFSSLEEHIYYLAFETKEPYLVDYTFSLDSFKSWLKIMFKLFYSSQATASVDSGLLLMAVMGLLFPAVLHSTHTELHFGKSELALSRFSSCIMLVAYASYLAYQLKRQKNQYIPVDGVSTLISNSYIYSLWIFAFDVWHWTHYTMFTNFTPSIFYRVLVKV